MARAQTIQIFLPSGNPQGLRQAEITTRTVQVFDIPRASLSEFLAMEQAHQVGVYFLFSDTSDTDERAECYIGETDDIGKRLRQHESKKLFWTRALVAISLTASWTKTHVRYFEAKAVRVAKDNGRYAVKNGNDGYANMHMPLPLQADCDEFFETISVLTATLGFPILRPLKSKQDTPHANILHVRGLKDTTSGSYSDEGLTVFAGTQIVPQNAKWRPYPAIAAQREALLDDGVLQQDESGAIVFAKDHLFPTPSGAACVIRGRSANGWEQWRDGQNQRLDAIVDRTGTQEEVP
ncbi:GIY-YIG nuclease family protein [Propioniferax innocua]|uniref:GIY-YIG catalytic domain-containing protein n=1 Tax=Propioniferax innocua TaxID=1753 RepID=A0A542ZT61_9ACTN|nr:GIY-YIG nuclease family protein [Propioniferax innocua]TQL63467.1 GIY-YIG catalytic domain-containing protein [Propioniferax innocua]